MTAIFYFVRPGASALVNDFYILPNSSIEYLSAEDLSAMPVFDESALNPVERANAELLRVTEFSRVSGGYLLDAWGYSYDPIYMFVNSTQPAESSENPVSDNTPETETDIPIPDLNDEEILNLVRSLYTGRQVHIETASRIDNMMSINIRVDEGEAMISACVLEVHTDTLVVHERTTSGEEYTYSLPEIFSLPEYTFVGEQNAKEGDFLGEYTCGTDVVGMYNPLVTRLVYSRGKVKRYLGYYQATEATTTYYTYTSFEIQGNKLICHYDTETFYDGSSVYKPGGVHVFILQPDGAMMEDNEIWYHPIDVNL